MSMHIEITYKDNANEKIKEEINDFLTNNLLRGYNYELYFNKNISREQYFKIVKKMYEEKPELFDIIETLEICISVFEVYKINFLEIIK